MATPSRVGKYEIAEKVGVGGFGVVYKAWDPYIQRWVALKTCTASNEEATKRFFREAQLAGALQHPNITLVFDFGIEDDVPFFVQEFLGGRDLDELLKGGELSLDGALAILLQVCTGLEFAHLRGIVHRDIKPANVRILEDGTVKIMDFGIAKSLLSSTNLTQSGVALGTAGYLAPEQLTDQPLDARTDVFSLGVMAYEMVTGERPFAGPNVSNVVYQILNHDPVPPRKRNPTCPERLERALLKALAKEPDKRFASVRDMAGELRQVLTTMRLPSKRADTTNTAVVRTDLARMGVSPASQVTTATELASRPLHRLQALEPTRPTVRRRRWLLPMISVIGLAAAGAGVTLWQLTRSSKEEARVAAALPTPVPATPAPPTPTPVPTPTPAPEPLLVEVFVDPASELDIDGRRMGRVQMARIQIPPGPHVFRQRIPGYREQTTTVEIGPDQQSVRLRLPPFGLLSVVTDFGVPLRDTKVFIDGSLAGPLPVLDRKVEAGIRDLVVRWPDGGEHREEIEVEPERKLTRTVRPQQPPA